MRTSLHPTSRSVLSILLAVFALMTAVKAAEPVSQNFSIPAGPAAESLKQFASQAGREIVFRPDAVGTETTNAVTGKLTPKAALDRMLAGTNLLSSEDSKTGAFAIMKRANIQNPDKVPVVTNDQSQKSKDDDVVTLSPFKVTSKAEQGYYATETLSGTRIRSDVKDIGSSMTIFTKEMMDDLGVNTLDKLLMFSPNTDPFVVSTDQTTNFGATFILNSTQYVARGGSTTVISQDFFTSSIPQDRYNSESLTFTRGPNSILFGQGDSVGGFTSSTKRAKLEKSATALSLEGGSYDRIRTSIDHNQVIKKGVLAIRYAGLYEASDHYRTPGGDQEQERNYVTVSFQPFKKTEIRANFESGNLRKPAIRPWGVYDAISPWRAAGSPLVPVFVNSAAGKPAGTENNTSSQLVSTEFTMAGTKVPTQVLRNTARSAVANYANGFPAWSTKRSFTDESIFPLFATYDGASYRNTDFKIYSISLEQEITDKLFISAAAQRTDELVVAPYNFVADQSYLYVDPNVKMPNGTPNPNVGMLYGESLINLFVQPGLTDNYRLMASYELDLTRKSGWLRHLGRHRLAAFGERTESRNSSDQLRIFNASPLVKTGPASMITNGNNVIAYRYYFDPAAGNAGITGGENPYDTVKTYLHANSPLPAADPSGITPAYASLAASASQRTLDTYGVSAQSFFLSDRLVATTGFRRDDSKLWQINAQGTAALADANGIRPDPAQFRPRYDFPNSLAAAGGYTYTRGVVGHVLPWLSLTYNWSENFNPNVGSYNIYGKLLPNPKGTGSDYGMRVKLLKNRLFINLVYYTLHNIDQFDPINSAPSGHIGNEFNALYAAVADFTGDQKYDSAPYGQPGQGWGDAAANSSAGVELSVTANLTDNWRLSLNGSKRGDNSTDSRGVITKQYMNEFLPFIESNPTWLPLVTAGGQTVAQRITNIRNFYTNFEAIKGVPASVYAPQWTLNLVTNYSFPKTVRLKGVAVGGSMNARGKSIAGFAEKDGSAIGTLNPDSRYYSPAYQIFGAWLNYTHKAFKGKATVRWQLNVRNIFDSENSVYPMRIVDGRDGQHTPSNAIYSYRDPRSFTLSTTIQF